MITQFPDTPLKAWAGREIDRTSSRESIAAAALTIISFFFIVLERYQLHSSRYPFLLFSRFFAVLEEEARIKFGFGKNSVEADYALEIPGKLPATR